MGGARTFYLGYPFFCNQHSIFGEASQCDVNMNSNSTAKHADRHAYQQRSGAKKENSETTKKVTYETATSSAVTAALQLRTTGMKGKKKDMYSVKEKMKVVFLSRE